MSVVSGPFTFVRLTRADFGLLGRWLAEPHVARWWAHDPSPAAVEDDFGDTADGLEPAEDHLVLLDGVPIGLVQYARFGDYPEYMAELADVYPVDAAAGSIDYFIGDPEHVGRGLGSAFIAAFVARVWATDPEVTHLVVPVHSDNVASWRALEKAGFRLVARGEMDPDNPADDRRHEILRIDRPPASG
jgi:aminoglycoside 6'-N-acetyltransferase